MGQRDELLLHKATLHQVSQLVERSYGHPT
jgi:hypothetical protein